MKWNQLIAALMLLVMTLSYIPNEVFASPASIGEGMPNSKSIGSNITRTAGGTSIGTCGLGYSISLSSDVYKEQAIACLYNQALTLSDPNSSDQADNNMDLVIHSQYATDYPIKSFSVMYLTSLRGNFGDPNEKEAAFQTVYGENVNVPQAYQRGGELLIIPDLYANNLTNGAPNPRMLLDVEGSMSNILWKLADREGAGGVEVIKSIEEEGVITYECSELSDVSPKADGIISPKELGWFFQYLLSSEGGERLIAKIKASDRNKAYEYVAGLLSGGSTNFSNNFLNILGIGTIDDYYQFIKGTYLEDGTVEPSKFNISSRVALGYMGLLCEMLVARGPSEGNTQAAIEAARTMALISIESGKPGNTFETFKKTLLGRPVPYIVIEPVIAVKYKESGQAFAMTAAEYYAYILGHKVEDIARAPSEYIHDKIKSMGFTAGSEVSQKTVIASSVKSVAWKYNGKGHYWAKTGTGNEIKLITGDNRGSTFYATLALPTYGANAVDWSDHEASGGTGLKGRWGKMVLGGWSVLRIPNNDKPPEPRLLGVPELSFSWYHTSSDKPNIIGNAIGKNEIELEYSETNQPMPADIINAVSLAVTSEQKEEWLNFINGYTSEEDNGEVVTYLPRFPEGESIDITVNVKRLATAEDQTVNAKTVYNNTIKLMKDNFLQVLGEPVVPLLQVKSRDWLTNGIAVDNIPNFDGQALAPTPDPHSPTSFVRTPDDEISKETFISPKISNRDETKKVYKYQTTVKIKFPMIRSKKISDSTYEYVEDDLTKTTISRDVPFENAKDEEGNVVYNPIFTRVWKMKRQTAAEFVEWISEPLIFSEIKEGTAGAEKYEAMAGVPSTEKLYYSSGGSTFVVDIVMQFVDDYRNDLNFKLNQNNVRGYYLNNPLGTSYRRAEDPRIAIHRTYNITYNAIPCNVNGTVDCPDPHGDGTHTHACAIHYSGASSHTITHAAVDARYMQIAALRVWRLQNSKVDGMERIIVEGNFKNNNGAVTGDARTPGITGGTYREIYPKTGIPEIETTIRTEPPELFWNAAKNNTSKEGRIWWSLEPYQYDEVKWVGTPDDECSNSIIEGPVNETAEIIASIYSQKVDARVLSDTLILRTYEGDLSVMYYEQKSESGPVNWAVRREYEEPPEIYYYTEYRNNNIYNVDMMNHSAYAGVNPGDSWKGQGGTQILKMESITKEDAWDNNPKCAANWSLSETIHMGSYNGRYDLANINNQMAKYGESDSKSNINFDSDTPFGKSYNGPSTSYPESSSAKRISANKTGSWGTNLNNNAGTLKQAMTASSYTTVPARTYTDKPQNKYILTSDSFDINIRNQNGTWVTGQSDVFYEIMIDYRHPKYTVEWDRFDQIDDDKYDREYQIEAQDRFGGKQGTVVSNAVYTRGSSKVNNILIDTPVSTEHSFIFEIPKERDQRVNNAVLIKDLPTDAYNNSDIMGKVYNNVTSIDGASYNSATFLNIDWGFQTYFPNTGDFYQSNDYSIGNLSGIKGINYVDDMDCSMWTEKKWVTFDWPVIYSGPITENRPFLFRAGEEIVLYDRGKDYAKQEESGTLVDKVDYLTQEVHKFYIPVAADEAAMTKAHFYSTAINSPNKDQALNPEENNIDRQASWQGKAHATKHSAHTYYFVDLVGRIGNLTMEDTEDPRYSMLFKKPTTSSPKWSIDDLIYEVSRDKSRYYIGDQIDIRGLPLNNEGIWLYLNRYKPSGLMSGGTGEKTNNSDYKLDTYANMPSRREHPIQFPLTSVKNSWDEDFTGKKTPSSLRKLNVLKGYDSYMNISTIGNYGGYMQINPKWYFVNYKTGEWTPTDIYEKVGNQYKLINKFNLMGEKMNGIEDAYPHYDELYMSEKIRKKPYNVDWILERERRNVTSDRLNEILDTWSIEPREEYDDPSNPETSNSTWMEGLGVSGNNIHTGIYQFIQLYGHNINWIGDIQTLNMNTNPNNEMHETYYWDNGHTWQWKIGLPSSARAVFTKNNDTWKTKTPLEKEFAKVEKEEGALVPTTRIIAIGDVWSLQYTGTTDFNDLIIYDENSTTGNVTSTDPDKSIEEEPNPIPSIDDPDGKGKTKRIRIPKQVLEGKTPDDNIGVKKDSDNPPNYQPGELGKPDGPKEIPLIAIDPKRDSSFDANIHGTH